MSIIIPLQAVPSDCTATPLSSPVTSAKRRRDSLSKENCPPTASPVGKVAALMTPQGQRSNPTTPRKGVLLDTPPSKIVAQDPTTPPSPIKGEKTRVLFREQEDEITHVHKETVQAPKGSKELTAQEAQVQVAQQIQNVVSNPKYDLPLPNLKPLINLPENPDSSSLAGLVSAIKKFPCSNEVHPGTLSILALLVLAQTKIASVWYKAITPLSDGKLLPNSFAALVEGEKLTFYVSNHQFLGDGTVGKATAVVRFIFEQKKCVSVDGEAIKLLCTVNPTTYERILNRIRMNEIFKDVPGIIPCFHAFQYVNGLGKHKVCLYLANFPYPLTVLFQRMFDPKRFSLTNRIKDFDHLVHLLAKTLDTIHKKGIIHRDIKADNLRVNERGNVAFGDFDLAVPAGDPSLSKTIGGTPEYLAPEILAIWLKFTKYHQFLRDIPQAHTTTTASDMASLGILLQEIYTGKTHPLSDFISKWGEARVSGNAELAEARFLAVEAQFNAQLALACENYHLRRHTQLPMPNSPEHLISALQSMIPTDRLNAKEMLSYKSELPREGSKRPAFRPELFEPMAAAHTPAIASNKPVE